MSEISSVSSAPQGAGLELNEHVRELRGLVEKGSIRPGNVSLIIVPSSLTLSEAKKWLVNVLGFRLPKGENIESKDLYQLFWGPVNSRTGTGILYTILSHPECGFGSLNCFVESKGTLDQVRLLLLRCGFTAASRSTGETIDKAELRSDSTGLRITLWWRTEFPQDPAQTEGSGLGLGEDASSREDKDEAGDRSPEAPPDTP